MNIVFLMDPLEKVIYEKDTSFFLMLGAHKRGHKVFFCPPGGITVLDGQVVFDAEEVVPQAVKDQPFLHRAHCRLDPAEVQAVLIRTDPPFNTRYLMDTWLLDLLPKSVVVVNAPHGIRTANEKIWAAQFTDLVPPTLITRRREDLCDFLDQHGEIVLKPTDSFGGQGIFRLKPGTMNLNAILETATRHFTKEVIAQRFIPQAVDGDKRILLLNGEPLGAILRVHGADDHRNNLFAGGEARPGEITDRDRAIIAALKPHLLQLGLMFVGIDILGDYLIEVNVTSPTCLQEMSRFHNQDLSQPVIAWLESQTQGPHAV